MKKSYSNRIFPVSQIVAESSQLAGASVMLMVRFISLIADAKTYLIQFKKKNINLVQNPCRGGTLHAILNVIHFVGGVFQAQSQSPFRDVVCPQSLLGENPNVASLRHVQRRGLSEYHLGVILPIEELI